MIRTATQLLLASLLCAHVCSAQDVDLDEQGTVRATPAQAFSGLGRSVGLHGNLAVAGAPGTPSNAPASGSAVVFEVSNGMWSQLAPLVPESDTPSQRFGAAVAVHGNTVLVGDPEFEGRGAVFVFERAGNESASWNEQARLLADDGAAFDQFGAAVALSGNVALVGAPLDDDNGERSGSVYVFKRTGDLWTQEAKLHAQTPSDEDRFGFAIALENDRALIGAPHATFPSNVPGFATVFDKQGGTWTPSATLQPATALAGDGFGGSVALSGGHALVGAPFHDALGSQSGAGFVFEWVDGAWLERATLLDSAGLPGDQAGQSVALANGVAFVGAPLANSAQLDTGRVLVWQRVDDGWQPRAAVERADAGAGDNFGHALDATSQRLVVGSPGDDDPQDSGSVTAFLADIVQQQTFFDVGFGLPGFFGQAVLDGAGTLEGGSPVSLSLSGAQPVSNAVVFLGASQVNLPLRGGTLVPEPSVITQPIFLGFEGGFFLEGSWPVGVPSGFELYAQAWWVDPGGPLGVAASNALRAVAP